MNRFLYPVLLIPFLLASCSKEDDDYQPVTSAPQQILNLPDTPYNYSHPDIPAYFYTNDNGPVPSSVNGIDNTPSDNPVTDAGATLGRVLFYDRNLSANESTACGSCHRAEKAFADSSPFSHGLFGDATHRNSMSLVNTRFYQRGHFFSDERAATLEAQVLMPMTDVKEMGLTPGQISQRVEAQPYYKDLFIKAFGNDQINDEKISMALAQFIRSIVSFKSKYDTGRAQVANMRDPFPNFSAIENRGKALFLTDISEGGAGCYNCHATEAMVSYNHGPANNGLDAEVTDAGAYATYPDDPTMRGAFKIPTLRNIALTGPYMHDARFTTLKEVVDHYNTGIQNSPALSPLLKDSDGLPVQLNLSEDDENALVAFLFTLTDSSIMSDAKWSDPFINQHL